MPIARTAARLALTLCLAIAALLPLRALAGGIDINTADSATLQSLPGIGETKAAAIIQYRTDHGPFKTVDELDNVSGIGPSTMASVRDLITVSGGAATGTAATPTTSSASTAASSSAASAPSSTPAASTSGGCPVNINTADVGGLKNLPGIGDSKAAAILAYRTDHGAFASCNDLDAVSGIGSATLSALAPCCSVK